MYDLEVINLISSFIIMFSLALMGWGRDHWISFSLYCWSLWWECAVDFIILSMVYGSGNAWNALNLLLIYS